MFFFFFRKFLGGVDGSGMRKDILEYNPVTEEWQEIGTMKEAINEPAVTHVSFEDYAAWCE